MSGFAFLFTVYYYQLTTGFIRGLFGKVTGRNPFIKVAEGVEFCGMDAGGLGILVGLKQRTGIQIV